MVWEYTIKQKQKKRLNFRVVFCWTFEPSLRSGNFLNLSGMKFQHVSVKRGNPARMG